MVRDYAVVQGITRPDRELLDAQALVGELVPPGSVFAVLAEHRHELFPDRSSRTCSPPDRTLQLADSGALCVPEGQPIPVEKFSEAVYLAEAPAHGGKPLLVFEP